MKKIVEETREVNQKEEREEKDTTRKEGVEKRKRAKKTEKQVRWSGLIMLVIIVLVGFLVWVTGEVNSNTEKESASREEPRTSLGHEKVIVR